MGLSSSEQNFLTLGVLNNLRNDGRETLDHRGFGIDLEPLPHASGSCRVTVDRTDVLVGVKMDLGQPDLNSADKGLIKCRVECAPCAFQSIDASIDPKELGLDLEQWISGVLMSPDVLDLKSLCIIPRHHCWVVYLDVLVLGYGGNVYDATLLAVRCALEKSKIPAIELKEDKETMEFDISEDVEKYTPIDVSNIPLGVTFNKIGDMYVLDASVQEELATTIRVTLALNKHSKLVSIHSTAGGSVSPGLLLDMMQNAPAVASDLFESIEKHVKETKPSLASGFLMAGY